MSLLSSAIDAFWRFAQLMYAFGVQFVGLVYIWLGNEHTMMLVLYISGFTILLLAALYASAASRRQGLRADGLVREVTMAEKLTQFAKEAEPQPGPLRPENKPSERDTAIDRRLREIQNELALLKSKVEGLESAGTGREDHQPAPSGAGSGSVTTLLRRELEALSAEMNNE